MDIMTNLAVLLATALAVLHNCDGFVPSSRSSNRPRVSEPRSNCNILGSKNHRYRVRVPFFLGPNCYQKPLRMAASNDDVMFMSDDPFVILGLDAPTVDKKVIKRAYKKRAMKFHPDVVTDIHSSPEEKKKASDRFSKINGAYEKLMGKGNEKSSTSAGSSSDSGYGYTPPHRRSSSSSSSGYSSSSYGENGSTDWRDYMPNYRKDEDETYDSGGDSFGQIFSDMFTGAASAAVSGGIGGMGGGIFNEFLEFLEGGAGGGMDNADDAQLTTLLQTGTLDEVAEEMDDTEMVVQQLETKSRGLDDEIFAMDAEAKMAASFSERLQIEEKAAELKARKDVVTGYLARARKRLLALQTRYKDLIAYGRQTDEYTASRGRRSSSSSWSDVREEVDTSKRASGGNTDNYGSSSSSSTSTGTSGTSRRTTTSSTNDSNSEDSWMNEGFGGTSGRSRGSGRRGSGRRRSRSRQPDTSSSTGVDSNPSPQPSPPPPSYSSTRSPQREQPRTTTRSSSSPSKSSSSAVSKSNYSNGVPPHRRSTGSYQSRQEEDRRRMREVKVDEEFEKLKKELGL